MLRFKIRPTVPAHVLYAIVKFLSFLFKDAIEVSAQHSNWLWAKPRYVPVRIHDSRHR
ncbi:hypothetical protein JNB88_08640 [Rhizobium cauense]|uniref:hypothetical protein n=1 Tax=Rhizobium cauense TaxID=1166683 RepID=UPI001C6EB12D|nr:hypothetical protein [Rhizobium cauense]MBW9113698.1 hypothetical protein [Rhizobium cauense]